MKKNKEREFRVSFLGEKKFDKDELINDFAHYIASVIYEERKKEAKSKWQEQKEKEAKTLGD